MKKNAPGAESAAPATATAAATAAPAAPKAPAAPSLESTLLALLGKNAKAYTFKELTAMVVASGQGPKGRNVPSVISGAVHRLVRKQKVVHDNGRVRLK